MYRTVSSYTGMNFKEIDDLYCDDFLLFYRNAVIESLMQSKEGQEILKEFRYANLEEDEALDRLDELVGL